MRVFARVLTALVGVPVWAVGCVLLIGGDGLVGGVLILAGGALILIAAQGGWGHFWEGLINWLYFR